MQRSFWPKILILAGIALACILFFARDNLKDDLGDIVDSAGILIHNFQYGLSPERSKPNTAIDKEESLKSFVGEPFTTFRRPDWDEFWNILYGIFPVDYSENERLPVKVRQLNYSEMEAKLKEAYPAPFTYFQDQHWQQFWQIVFGKKAKRR